MKTINKVRQLLISQMEPAERFNKAATAILKVLEENEGKLLTKRIEAKLQEATNIPNLRIQRRYGMTQIVWESTAGMLLDHSEKNVYIDLVKFKRYNAAYFEAREVRNKTREEILQTDLPERIDAAIEEYLIAKEKLSKLFDQVSGVLYSFDFKDMGVDI